VLRVACCVCLRSCSWLNAWWKRKCAFTAVTYINWNTNLKSRDVNKNKFQKADALAFIAKSKAKNAISSAKNSIFSMTFQGLILGFCHSLHCLSTSSAPCQMTLTENQVPKHSIDYGQHPDIYLTKCSNELFSRSLTWLHERVKIVEFRTDWCYNYSEVTVGISCLERSATARRHGCRISVFCSRLKTHLFKRCFPWHSYCCRAREVTVSFRSPDTLIVFVTYLLTYLLTY